MSSASRKLFKPTPTTRQRCCGLRSTRPGAFGAMSVNSSQEDGGNPGVWVEEISHPFFRRRASHAGSGNKGWRWPRSFATRRVQLRSLADVDLTGRQSGGLCVDPRKRSHTQKNGEFVDPFWINLWAAAVLEYCSCEAPSVRSFVMQRNKAAWARQPECRLSRKYAKRQSVTRKGLAHVIQVHADIVHRD
jgi:hypothetical protein